MSGRTDVDRLATYTRQELGSNWKAWPGGYPNEIEAALIDAILSIRARYGTPTTGVRGAVRRWREYRGEPLDDLGVLARADPERLASTLVNRQKVRSGSTKATAITEAPAALVTAGVTHAAQFDADDSAQRQAYVGIEGLGDVTWKYLGMLLGADSVKADTWVLRFVEAALGSKRSADESKSLLVSTAERLDVSATTLDHAIWERMRRRPIPG